MARRIPRYAFLLLLVLGLSSCGRYSERTQEAEYEVTLSHLQRGDLLVAQQEAEKAYKLYEKRSPDWAWRFRVLQAETLVWQGLSKKGLELLAEELPPSLSNDEAAVRRKIIQGLAYSFLQDFPQAKRRLAEAETLALTVQPKLLGEVALSQGTLFVLRGDYFSAEAAFQRALEIARHEQLPFLEANALGSLGLTNMRMQHYGEAIDWYKASDRLSESLGARTVVAKNLGNMGWSYYKTGDLDASLDLFMKAQSLANQLGLRKDESRWLTNIGNIHYDRHELEEAQTYYQRALDMAEQLDDRSDWAICLANLAVVSIQRGQLDDAERYNQQALELGRLYQDALSELHYVYNEGRIAIGQRRLAEAKTLMQQVIAGSKSDSSLRWLAQAKLASIYAALKQPELADQAFRSSLATIGEARSSLNREEYRLSFLSNAITFYDDYVSFLVGRGRIKDALHVVELNRARTLSEGLGIKQDSGSLRSATFQPEATARRLGAVILSYWLARERSYLWVITSSKVELLELPPQTEIEQAVRSYRSALAGARDVRETGNANGQKLYQTLVEPADKLIPSGARVIIIPDGGLYELNFETLLVPGDQLHYWIEDVVVANASSLLLLQNRLSDAVPDQNNLLLIGNPALNGSEYTTLPQAASEIGQIKTYFPASKVQLYEGQQATAKAYLEGDPGRFSLIHFVAHGVASRQSPLDSAVILSGDENSHKLYGREIVKVPIRARLVVVSSCEGASGRTYAGEGLVGLSWAFLRAGAHQVIAALWEVNDAATPEFMHNFYAGISAGSEPAVALRTAKLAMLHSDTIYRRPFYWAPFQLYQGR